MTRSIARKKVAGKVLHKGADYPLAVKDNQPKFMQAFEQSFPINELISFEGDAYVTDEKNRGRQETRYHFASDFAQ